MLVSKSFLLDYFSSLCLVVAHGGRKPSSSVMVVSWRFVRKTYENLFRDIFVDFRELSYTFVSFRDFRDIFVRNFSFVTFS